MGNITTNPLFLLARIPKTTRIFVAVSILAGYGLFLYEMLPEYLFIPASAMTYFAIPSIAIIAVFVVLPMAMLKGKQPSNQTSGQTGQIPEQQVEVVPLDQTKDSTIILPDNMSPGTFDGLIPSQSPISGEAQPPAIIPAPAVDEMALQNMVSRAMEPVQKDSSRMQDTITDLRTEIDSIKSSMSSLASTVESSLTDLKSFQAEIANPLNFMRKYFDSIDIKSLSDPTLPLHVEKLPLDTIESHEEEKEPVPAKNDSNATIKKSRDIGEDEVSKTEYIEGPVQSESNEVMSFKQMLGGKITLGRLMTTITLMEEILQTLGRDSIDVLIDQCKLMGLNQEDEHIVYNVINMMDKSGLSVNDTLIMLYKFGKVMGMNDRESDLIYAKLMINQGKNHESMVAVEKKV